MRFFLVLGNGWRRLRAAAAREFLRESDRVLFDWTPGSTLPPSRDRAEGR